MFNIIINWFQSLCKKEVRIVEIKPQDYEVSKLWRKYNDSK